MKMGVTFSNPVWAANRGDRGLFRIAYSTVVGVVGVRPQRVFVKVFQRTSIILTQVPLRVW